MKKTRKRYTDEFREQAVELARSGRGVPATARELEVETSCLYAWIRAANSQPSQVGSADRRAGGEDAEADERRRLRGENARLTLENVL